REEGPLPRGSPANEAVQWSAIWPAAFRMLARASADNPTQASLPIQKSTKQRIASSRSPRASAVTNSSRTRQNSKYEVQSPAYFSAAKNTGSINVRDWARRDLRAPSATPIRRRMNSHQMKCVGTTPKQGLDRVQFGVKTDGGRLRATGGRARADQIRRDTAIARLQGALGVAP